MLCSLATKAGAMAGRRGALSGSGKVACVDAPWGGGLGGGGGEGRSVHATAYCPRHVDPLPSACLPCLSFNLCCVDKGPRQGVHAQVHSYTPTGKGRVLRGARGAFLSTTHTGTGTGSGGNSANQYAVASQVVGGVLGVISITAVAVHHYEQDKAATEIKRVEGERVTEIKRVEGERVTEVKRVEGERRLSEERLRAEVDRYKYDLQLRYSQDFKSYQDAKEQANKERGGTGGPQKEEETH
jgi:hypothetical protein